MNPHISLGPFTIYYYGLILGLAIVVAYFYARVRAKKYRIASDVIDTLVIWAVPLGIIGARLYYVLFSLDQFSGQPLNIFFIWQGGLAIHGALLGGFVGAWIGLSRARRKHKNLDISTVLDVLAPTLFLGQIIGRFANYVNQEAFGGPTTLPWSIFIRPERRPLGLENFERFHPTFAYEAIWNLLGLGIVLLFEKKHNRKTNRTVNQSASSQKKTGGLVFAFYVAWYSLGRLWIEALRTDALLLGPVRVAQVMSIIGIIAAGSFIWYRFRQWRHPAPSA